MLKKVLIWVFALIITLSAAVYQRYTGPTKPKRIEFTLNENTYKVKLDRTSGEENNSHGRPGSNDARIKLSIKDSSITAKIYYRKFKSEADWISADFTRYFRKMDSWFMNKILGIYEVEGLLAKLPQQPPAGKLEYYIEVYDGEERAILRKDNPIVIRFKAAVPGIVLVPHIIIMFFAMFLSNLAGLMAIANISRFRVYTILTFIFLALGGMILGPIVQKYAFGDLWTGVPFGWDLTDNKTLIAFLFWGVALLWTRNSKRRYLTIIASLILFAIYTIPHSMFGSELDYTTGKVTQGIIQIFHVLF